MVYRFNNEIFPIKLAIMFKPTLEELNDNFRFIDDSVFVKKDIEDCLGRVFPLVVNKSDDKYYLLAIFIDDIESSSFVHESVHVAQKICSYINEDNVGIETQAYLVQWAFNCINKSWEQSSQK